MYVALNAVIKAHGRRFRLGPISATLTPGVTCVLGENGAGKTTLLSSLAGLIKPTSGSILHSPCRLSLGILPQEYRLPGRATVEQFLTYAAWVKGMPAASWGGAVEAVLKQVGLGEDRSCPIRKLSGGMTRRLAIAQALLGDPKVLILDEPTAGLDPLQRAVTREAIKKLKTGRIVVLSTHLLEDARAVADRLLVLVDGRLLFDGDVASLEALDSPSAPGESPLERALNALMLRRKGSPE